MPWRAVGPSRILAMDARAAASSLWPARRAVVATAVLDRLGPTSANRSRRLQYAPVTVECTLTRPGRAPDGCTQVEIANDTSAHRDRHHRRRERQHRTGRGAGPGMQGRL